MSRPDNLSTLAPVALFVYRRYELLGEVLAALQGCVGYGATPVFIFSDGPRGEADRPDVERVRRIVQDHLTPNMRIKAAGANAGLDPAIISGVGWLLSKYERVIVIEDDLLVAPEILQWFNAALHQYRDSPSVMQISGHAFDAPRLAGRREGLFLPFGTSWGWATWRRAWSRFDAQASGWEVLMSDRALRRRFNLDGAYDYCRLLRTQMDAPVPMRAWDIRWYWSMFKEGGLCLFPPETLVLNLGFGSRATHSHSRTRLMNHFRPPLRLGRRLPEMPSIIAVEDDCYSAVRRAIRWRRI